MCLIFCIEADLLLESFWRRTNQRSAQEKELQGSISLVEDLENDGEITKEMLSFVHAQVGFVLLFDLHFKEAVDHFLLSENMQPSELFPFIMPDPNCWTLLVCLNFFLFVFIVQLNFFFVRLNVIPRS